MGRCKLFRVAPGRSGGLIKPADPDYRVPERYPKVPGYVERARAVAKGQLAPWWGTEYASVRDEPGQPISDLVYCSPSPVYAVSGRLMRALESEGIAGLRFYPVRVDGETTMYILGVAGQVAVNPKAFELHLLDGAEVGLRDEASLYVNARVMDVIRREEIDLYAECAVQEKDG